MFAARVSNSYMPNCRELLCHIQLAEWIRWYREGRLKAFDEGGRKVYDTIAGRRRRLGLAA